MNEFFEAITLFQVYKEQYLFLWAFYFTASLGLIGFCYGHSHVRSSKLARFGLTVVYVILLTGNYLELCDTRHIMASIKDTLSKYSNNIANAPDGEVYSEIIIQHLRVPSELQFNVVYIGATVMIVAGIWFLDIVKLVNSSAVK